MQDELPELFFGVPHGEASRRKYLAALLLREGDERKCLDSLDRYLEIIASRSSSLLTFYSILLTALIFTAQKVDGRAVAACIVIAGLLIAISAGMLLYALWIHWRRDPADYARSENELHGTMRLLCRRSILFNGSIAVSISASILAFGAVTLNFLATR